MIDQLEKEGFITTTVESAIGWARKNSIWPMPLGISCCAMVMMATLYYSFVLGYGFSCWVKKWGR